MRIAFHVPRASYLKPGHSGDKVFAESLVACLRARGHELRIVSRMNFRGYSQGRISLWQMFVEALAVRREMRAFAPDAWLVYGASVKWPDLFGWWQRPKRYVHIFSLTDSGRSVPRRWRWLFRAIYRRSLTRADRISIWPPNVADRLCALGVPAGRISHLPFAVKIWDHIPDLPEARRRLGLAETESLVLCVSRFSTLQPGKKWCKTDWVLKLLDVMVDVPEPVVLVLVGEGPGRAQIEDRIVQLGLQDRVRMVGAVPYVELSWYYAACDLSASFVLTELVFTTMQESQGCGCPVVMLRSRASEIAADHGRTGLLAEDAAEFASHIAAIALDRPRRDAMSRAAIQFIAENHAMTVRGAQIEGLLTVSGGLEAPAAASVEGQRGMAAVREPE